MKTLPQLRHQLRAQQRLCQQHVQVSFYPRRSLVLSGLIISMLLFCSSQARATGALDPAFGTGGKVITDFGSTDHASDMLVQPDGKIIVVGTAYFQPVTMADLALVRYNTNGTLDTGFGTGGKVLIDIAVSSENAHAAVLQPDGKIVVVGIIGAGPPPLENNFVVVRLNPNGSLDGTFGNGGKVTTSFGEHDTAVDVGLESNGKIVVLGQTGVGSASNIAIARYNTDGNLDASFGVSGKVISDVNIESNDNATALAIQTDGKIIVGAASNSAMALVRYDSAGNLDSSFGLGGIARADFAAGTGAVIEDIALQSDGKIVTAGSWIINGSDFLVVRYLSNGSLDTSFGTGGKTSTDFFRASDTAFAIAIRADGKIAVAGQASAGFGTFSAFDYAVALYNSDGSLAGKASTDFAGHDDYGRAVAFQADGKVLVAGMFDPATSGINNFGVARYNSIFIAPTAFDFDGDGKTDISTYRPGAASHWYIIRSSWFYTQPNQFEDVQFGMSGDIIVPADYDGDGKTNYAVFRPSTGAWYTSTNAAINYGAFQWGVNGDIPVPGDYDGDGKADHAIYRPSTGAWWVVRSSDGGVIQQVFGTSADKPVIGDFDGDRKTDFAYVSTSGGLLIWNIRQSSNGAVVTQQFGLATDKAVPADYDGDGSTNIAVFRAATGRWYTSLNPATNYGEVRWGTNGDIAVPGDYEGDGKADIAIFRPSNGNWYIRKSVDVSLLTERWGLSTDIPVPSAFTPQ